MIRLIAFAAFAFAVATSAQCNIIRAASSAGRHDHASPRSMWCRYAHGEWCLHNYIRPPPRTPGNRHRPLKNLRSPQVCANRMEEALRRHRTEPGRKRERCSSALNLLGIFFAAKFRMLRHPPRRRNV